MRPLISGVLAALLVTSGVHAQPQPDFARAKELYLSAGEAMKEGRYSDAARDFGAAYDITHDPVLFYKIGDANEKAGKCDVALVYYARYLKEAKPAANFVALTKERIVACGGKADEPAPPVDTGSGSAVVTPVDTGAGSASTATPTPAPAPSEGVKPHKDGAWLMVGGALAFVTAGAVLAYSARSSEQDLKDLYVGLNGVPPQYDANTQKRYQDLIDEGHRYQYMSWAAFGIAGAAAIGAVFLFRSTDEPEHKPVTLVPVITPREAGVSALVRF